MTPISAIALRNSPLAAGSAMVDAAIGPTTPSIVVAPLIAIGAPRIASVGARAATRCRNVAPAPNNGLTGRAEICPATAVRGADSVTEQEEQG